MDEDVHITGDLKTQHKARTESQSQPAKANSPTVRPQWPPSNSQTPPPPIHILTGKGQDQTATVLTALTQRRYPKDVVSSRNASYPWDPEIDNRASLISGLQSFQKLQDCLHQNFLNFTSNVVLAASRERGVLLFLRALLQAPKVPSLLVPP